MLTELLFSLPVSNAKVEQVFSPTKLIKKGWKIITVKKNFEYLDSICMEGPEQEFFSPIPTITLWDDDHLELD